MRWNVEALHWKQQVWGINKRQNSPLEWMENHDHSNAITRVHSIYLKTARRSHRVMSAMHLVQAQPFLSRLESHLIRNWGLSRSVTAISLSLWTAVKNSFRLSTFGCQKQATSNAGFSVQALKFSQTNAHIASLYQRAWCISIQVNYLRTRLKDVHVICHHIFHNVVIAFIRLSALYHINSIPSFREMLSAPDCSFFLVHCWVKPQSKYSLLWHGR